MFKKSTLLALSLTALLSAGAQAQYYGGVSYANLDYSEEGQDSSLSAIIGRLGWSFNDVLSTEARVGFGVGEDSTSVDSSLGKINVDVKLKNMVGAYIRASLPISDQFQPYLLAGYTRTKIEATASLLGYKGKASGSESDISAGLGADWVINDTLRVNGEYTSYVDKSNGAVKGFTLGVTAKF